MEGNTKGAILVVTYERWHTTTYIGVVVHFRNLMNLKGIFRAVLLTYDWEVSVEGSREELIHFFSRKFKGGKGIVGGTTWKSIFFMCPTLGTIHNFSLVGFDGTIVEGNPTSIIKMEARFGQPFIWMYVLAALTFPVFYILDLYNQREALNFFNNYFLNLLGPPILIWLTVMIYYQFKLASGKAFIKSAIEEFSK